MIVNEIRCVIRCNNTVALGQIPPLQQLQHMNRITPLPSVTASQPPYAYNVVLQNAPTHQPVAAHNISPPVPVGEAFLPVSQKLVSKIESGAFVDMAELLPDHLGNTRVNLSDEQGSSRPKKRSVTSILEWIQCLSIYTSIISKKQPESVPDLLGYQTLLIDAYLEYRGDTWVGYDRRFRLTAAANTTKVWAHIDPTLWNLAFAGIAKTSRCTHCFSLNHASRNCEWAPDPPTAATQPTLQPYSRQRQRRICFKWNSTPGQCPVLGCTFDHVCIHCGNTLLCATKLTRASIIPSIQHVF